MRSHLCFCSQAWAPQSVVNILFIESIQRRASRFIVGKASDLSYKARLIKLRLLPLNYWLEYLDLISFYKCMHGLLILLMSLISTFLFFRGAHVVLVLHFALGLTALALPISAIIFSIELQFYCYTLFCCCSAGSFSVLG